MGRDEMSRMGRDEREGEGERRISSTSPKGRDERERRGRETNIFSLPKRERERETRERRISSPSPKGDLFGRAVSTHLVVGRRSWVPTLSMLRV